MRRSERRRGPSARLPALARGPGESGRVPLDFTAIDFETANSSNASACAVGLVRVRDGRVVETAGWLIRPPAGHDVFFELNVRIHGIRPEDVAGAATWTEQLSRLASFAGDDVLVAHNAGFDMAVLKHTFGIMPHPVYCTKIASRLARTFTDRHGLKDLAKELLGIELSKQQQSSDWGADKLTQEQLNYAASDVLHLHALREKLDSMLVREGREHLARACFGFLPTRVDLDLQGWSDIDPFAH